MTVHGTEYRMWAVLARREDLPEEAFTAVVDGLLPDDVDSDGIVAAAAADHVNLLIRQGLLGPSCGGRPAAEHDGGPTTDGGPVSSSPVDKETPVFLLDQAREDSADLPAQGPPCHEQNRRYAWSA